MILQIQIFKASTTLIKGSKSDLDIPDFESGFLDFHSMNFFLISTRFPTIYDKFPYQFHSDFQFKKSILKSDMTIFLLNFGNFHLKWKWIRIIWNHYGLVLEVLKTFLNIYVNHQNEKVLNKFVLLCDDSWSNKRFLLINLIIP